MNSRNEILEKELLEWFQGKNVAECSCPLGTKAQVLGAAVQLYQATKDSFYSSYVLEALGKLVSDDGSVAGFSEGSLLDYEFGNIIYFAWTQAKEEKYEKAVKKLAAALASQPKSGRGVFMSGQEEEDLAEAYSTQVFYMNYETKHGGKEHYNEIIAQYNSLHDKQFMEAVENCQMGAVACYCAALIDSMEVTEQPVYENFRRMQDLFKEGVKAFLNRNGGKPEADNTACGLIMAYAILKGCRMKALHTEKYEACALAVLDAAQAGTIKEQPAEYAAALAAAYSESLKNREYQDYGRGKGGALWS